MDMLKKPVLKKAGIYCLILLCLFAVLFPVRTNAAPVSTPVTLEVEQVFTKPAGSAAADSFTYRLAAKETGNPMPTGSAGDSYTFTVSGTSRVDVGPIAFTQAGIYNYEIAPYNTGHKTGYTCDSQIYAVTVYIKSDLEADVIIRNKDEDKVSAVQFQNEYAPLASDPSLMMDPPVKKTVSGSPGKNGIFTFKLAAADPSFPMPQGSANGVKLITIVGPGEQDFGTWSYTQAGTYFYTISEVNNGEAGYTYDAMVYTITDKVEDVNGRLILTRTITNASNKPVTSLDFINKFAQNPGGGPAGGPAGGGATGPKTGDDSMLEFHFAAFCVSSLVFLSCVTLLLKLRKRAGKRQKRGLCCHESIQN